MFLVPPGTVFMNAAAAFLFFFKTKARIILGLFTARMVYIFILFIKVKEKVPSSVAISGNVAVV